MHERRAPSLGTRMAQRIVWKELIACHIVVEIETLELY